MASTTSLLAAAVIDSPVGALTIAGNDDVLMHLSFGRDESVLGVSANMDAGAHPVLRHVADELDQYFAGTRRTFTVTVDPRGTQFQRAAWFALLAAEFGRTMSYADQAAHIGKPTATRAVGAANGRNPVAIVLPCHRVVGKNGTLTGFAGGLDVKQWLLDHERAVAARDK